MPGSPENISDDTINVAGRIALLKQQFTFFTENWEKYKKELDIQHADYIKNTNSIRISADELKFSITGIQKDIQELRVEVSEKFDVTWLRGSGRIILALVVGATLVNTGLAILHNLGIIR